MKKSLCALAFMVLAAPGYAGPFGIDLNTFSPETYGCEDIKDGFYRCASVPSHHPDMERYIVQYVPEIGVCFIKGMSLNITDSIYGDKTRAAVTDIANQLKLKYGELEHFDYLRTGSIWDEPEDWMRALDRDERVFAYSKSLETPVDGITHVGVHAKGLGVDTSYWAVEFYTPLSDACDAHIAQQKGGVF